MSLSVTMIVRNSSDVLERCLESVKGADEIVIVDTGSQDETIEIAKRYTDKVYSYYGCNVPRTAEGEFMSFADARNKSLSYCTSTHCLQIDADEVLVTPVSKLKNLECESLSVNCINTNTGEEHRFPRVFMNHPKIYWKGVAHNYLTCGNGELSDVVINYYTNKQKKKDPDRTLRILEHWVRNNPRDCTRELYYLSKEYHKRGQLKKTVSVLRKYIRRSLFTVEKADAFVVMSRCYAGLNKHKDAINCCMAAINLNPDFGEALRLAGDLNGDINRLKYQYLASKATNHGVLFIRPNKRIKVTVLSDEDIDNEGYRLVQEIRKTSKGQIDIELITAKPNNRDMAGAPLFLIGNQVAQSRIDDSDIIHYKDNHPYQRKYHDLIIRKGKKIVRLIDIAIPGENYKADYKACTNKIEGFEFMPPILNNFKYSWKRGKKFRIAHMPSEVKGTNMIGHACKLLDREDIEFVSVKGIDPKGGISLFIDQMTLPVVGMSSYLALSHGIPVINWSKDDIVLSPDKQTAESLAATIDAVLNWDILEGLSLAAFKDVQERCGEMDKKWIEVYESLK